MNLSWPTALVAIAGIAGVVVLGVTHNLSVEWLQNTCSAVIGAASSHFLTTYVQQRTASRLARRQSPEG